MSPARSSSSPESTSRVHCGHHLVLWLVVVLSLLVVAVIVELSFGRHFPKNEKRRGN